MPYSTIHDNIIQDKTRQDKTRQDKSRQNKTRQVKTKQDKTNNYYPQIVMVLTRQTKRSVQVLARLGSFGDLNPKRPVGV